MRTEVTLPPARLLWSDLEQPSDLNGKFGVKIGLPKDANMGPLRDAINAAKSALANPKKARLPVSNGDQSDHENEKGYWVLRASTKFQPACFDADSSRIGVDELYSGCMVRVKVTVYDYNFQGSPGVGLMLHWVQFAGAGERLAGGMDVEPPPALEGVGTLRGSASPASSKNDSGWSDDAPPADSYPDYPEDDTEIPF